MALIKKFFKKKDELEDIEKDLESPFEKEPDFSTPFGSAKTTFGEEPELTTPPPIEPAPLQETKIETTEDTIITKIEKEDFDCSVIVGSDPISHFPRSLSEKLASKPIILIILDYTWTIF